MTEMSPACLHALSFYEMLSTGGFGQVAEFASGEKVREADKSDIPPLGILCSILLSYGGICISVAYSYIFVLPCQTVPTNFRLAIFDKPF
jgi:hypothetical protein